jgi:hypothetical protein
MKLRQSAVWVLVLGCAIMALALPLRAADQAGLRLLMIEQPGCAYCVAFNRDIAPIYKISDEGAAAPLVHADLRDGPPDGMTFASRPFVTPTFILIGPDGHELSRLTGFPGEDFFWPYIAQMISDAQDSLPASALD